jgi:poly(A) polymerase
MTEQLGIPPSKRLGELRKTIEERCERGELASHQPIDFYIGWVREHAAELGL